MASEFPFQRITGGGSPAPFISATFISEKDRQPVNCLVDSGADLTTLPRSIGESLGIDFSKSADAELAERWNNVDRGNHEQVTILVKEIMAKKVSIKTRFFCACNSATEGWYFPVTIEIAGKSFPIMVLWSSIPSTPLIGRLGVFDNIEELTFKKNQNIIFKF